MIKLDKNTTLLFYGDSITDGARGRTMDGNHIMGHGYASIVASKFALDNIENMPKFINKGISGNTSSDLLRRLEDDVLKYKPDIISILVGINDVLMGENLSAKEIGDNYISNLQKITDAVRHELKNSEIIILEPFYLELDNIENPYTHTPYVECEEPFTPAHVHETAAPYIKRREAIWYIQTLLKEFIQKNNYMFVPLQEEFLNQSKKAKPEYLVWDTIHPTITGHEIIARKWLEVAKRELTKSRQ
ncbi:MAG: SGNH/GDSL hydrolase family protein [Clostridia bacterium]|nr:SGNH/GDSL hydrolase family protein [Clostridia bacterium]